MDGSQLELLIKRLAIWVFVCVGMIVFDSLGWFGPVRKGFELLVAPFERLSRNAIYISASPVRMLSYYRSGEARILDLQSRLAEKMVDQSKVDQLQLENEQLRQLLQAPIPKQWQLQPAVILGQTHGQLVIKAGKNVGVKTGMTVVAKEVYVGQIVQVSETTSLVLLTADSKSRVAAKISNKNLNGLVVNQNGKLILDQVLPGSSINPGEIVVTAGTDGVAPLLTIGRIDQVITQTTDVYKQVSIIPAVDVSQLQSVGVIIKEGGNN
jgi:rod shape-determining protein MreC